MHRGRVSGATVDDCGGLTAGDELAFALAQSPSVAWAIPRSYILWVNRDERGFSNGGHFADPRTGEIIVAKPRITLLPRVPFPPWGAR